MRYYFTYIIECNDGTYYVGKTTDISHRLRQHNGEIKGGAKYTAGRRPVKLKFLERHETLSSALKREYKLKQLKLEKKLELINSVTSS
jgi:putative endonuclease